MSTSQRNKPQRKQKKTSASRPHRTGLGKNGSGQAILGVDSGGTFTDCVLIDESGRIFHDKAFSDPQDMEGSVLSAIQNVAAMAGKDLSGLLTEAR
ncbi:MAG: hydantoinase/oxoprolinase N-terminal domain-containing protein, partial [Nitrospinota bacterium]|nr:hydantoinase/oxoprolinase N-terminal domain-containing protein [Nitrospinota bacterium]